MAVATKPGPFVTQPSERLLQEAEDSRLRRAVGALDLTALGIGAVIGTGIFVIIGEAIADSGPGIVLSFVVAGVTCVFSALSYAELASTIPVSGSAYTYAYATLGEAVAWIIGWDLMLEYAVGNVAVAIAWSDYFTSLLRVFGMEIPYWLTTSYRNGAIASPSTCPGWSSWPPSHGCWPSASARAAA